MNTHVCNGKNVASFLFSFLLFTLFLIPSLLLIVLIHDIRHYQVSKKKFPYKINVLKIDILTFRLAKSIVVTFSNQLH